MSRVGYRIVGAAWLGLILGGCGRPEATPEPPKQPFKGIKVEVAALDDPRLLLSGLDAQLGEWVASTGAQAQARHAPVDLESLKLVDVLVFPGDRLGDLVDRGALVVLPEDKGQPAEPKEGAAASEEAAPKPPPDPFAPAEVVASFRDQVTKYGEDRYGLPLGGTALVLAYRRDAFDRPENRAAARAAGVRLEPPRTWADLDALARFFHGRDWDGDGTADSGIALAWAADPEGVGDSTFLALAASLGQHRDQYSFLLDADRAGPRIASPPFVEALRALVALTKSAPPGAAQFDADAARSAFRSGRAALLIDRAERASTWSEGKPVAVAPLPGSDRVYNPDRRAWETPTSPNRPTYLPRGGGWLVGVMASSAHRDAAIDLARYLAGPDVTNRLRADRTVPVLATRIPQLTAGMPDPKSAPGVDPRSWSDAVGRTTQAVRVVVGLRIPGAAGYLADLTEARVAAAGGKPAEDALKEAAEKWSRRTESFGPKRQTWHYRRSLNRLVTTPEPPPRGE